MTQVEAPKTDLPLLSPADGATIRITKQAAAKTGQPIPIPQLRRIVHPDGAVTPWPGDPYPPPPSPSPIPDLSPTEEAILDVAKGVIANAEEAAAPPDEDRFEALEGMVGTLSESMALIAQRLERVARAPAIEPDVDQGPLAPRPPQRQPFADDPGPDLDIVAAQAARAAEYGVVPDTEYVVSVKPAVAQFLTLRAQVETYRRRRDVSVPEMIRLIILQARQHDQDTKSYAGSGPRHDFNAAAGGWTG